MIAATPNAPGKPEVDDVDEDSITLSWQKPKDDGGDKVTGYQVEMKEEGSSKWKPCNDFAIRDTFYTGELVTLIQMYLSPPKLGLHQDTVYRYAGEKRFHGNGPFVKLLFCSVSV